ncbi:cAMP-activated global transcriptional regulator CRP [bacterium HR11]|nr:cAMP-activated global transcriptional regulator CRP [bacterium HR11]
MKPTTPSALLWWYFQRMELFQGLPEEELRWLHRQSLMRHYRPGTYIALSLPDESHIYMVKAGFVELGYRDARGRVFVVDLLGPGDFFGRLSFGGHVDSFARAAGEVDLCIIAPQAFLSVIERYPDLALRVLQRQAAYIRLLESRLRGVVFQDVRHRILHLLSDFHRRFARRPDECLEIPLTHRAIASMVGCSRETASLYLSRLKKAGIIDYTRRYICIRDPQGLQEKLPSLFEEEL